MANNSNKNNNNTDRYHGKFRVHPKYKFTTPVISEPNSSATSCCNDHYAKSTAPTPMPSNSFKKYDVWIYTILLLLLILLTNIS